MRVNDPSLHTLIEGSAEMVTLGAALVIPVKSEKPLTAGADSVFDASAEYLSQGSVPLYLAALMLPSVPTISAGT